MHRMQKAAASYADRTRKKHIAQLQSTPVAIKKREMN
jgi:hypothetical protein